MNTDQTDDPIHWDFYRREDSHINDPILSDFTEGNEGNEDRFSSYITRFVLLVAFCSKSEFES
jgi:hypothetical protein